ncbi:MAG: hypothetical protein C4575_03830 [Desulforudis sp.]|jgi:hypothetical protein|nr:MAG: hypothetical protein C4575_03830 [Desulforudis sp.]
MKKQISIGIAIIACVALCAAVWPRSVEGGKVPAEPVKPAVIAEIEVKLEETSPITLSADNRTSEPELVAEIEPPIFEETTTEEKTEPTPPAKPAQQPATAAAPAQSSPDPKPGTIKIVHGERCMWIPGFGWVKDEGGGSIAIPVDGEGDINKQVGVMGGGSGTTVGNPDDELTGHKVGIMSTDSTPPSEKHDPAPGTKAVIDDKPSIWIPGFGWIEDNNAPNVGTVAEDMYENGHKIRIMD